MLFFGSLFLFYFLLVVALKMMKMKVARELQFESIILSQIKCSINKKIVLNFIHGQSPKELYCLYCRSSYPTVLEHDTNSFFTSAV